MDLDLTTVITSIISSVGISLTGAWWLAKQLVTHRLNKDMEDYKAEWKGELDRERVQMQGTVKERVETILGERAAEREYQLEAKKRLYLAIGPLKFQLLLACRDFAHRVEGHGLTAAYKMESGGYYGDTTLYRLLRPLAIGELIERQVAYADFSVDSTAIDLLRFKKSATRALSGDAVTLNHPNLNWDFQIEHVFVECLSLAIDSIIEEASAESIRVMGFQKFSYLLDNQLGEKNEGIRALVELLHDFAMETKPIFWVRLIAFAHICREHLKQIGGDLGFEYTRLPIKALLERSKDPFIIGQIDKYIKAIEDSILLKL